MTTRWSLKHTMQNGQPVKIFQIEAEVAVSMIKRAEARVEKISILVVKAEVEELVVIDKVENFLVTRVETHVITAKTVRRKMLNVSIVERSVIWSSLASTRRMTLHVCSEEGCAQAAKQPLSEKLNMMQAAVMGKLLLLRYSMDIQQIMKKKMNSFSTTDPVITRVGRNIFSKILRIFLMELLCNIWLEACMCSNGEQWN